MIRSGTLEKIFPTHFPSGEGSDFAGVVVAVGENVNDFAKGDEVLGWSDERSSHATHVSVAANHVVRKPPQLSWEIAGSLYVAGLAAWASVEAVEPKKGDVVVVSGAAGGVGSIAVQLLRLRGATVIAIASPKNHDWLKKLAGIPVDHDAQTAEHIRKASPTGRVDAWVDVFGRGYVDMAIQLGVQPQRINTTIDWAAAQRHGTKMQGTSEAGGVAALSKLAALVADGKVEITIAARYPLDKVREDLFNKICMVAVPGRERVGEQTIDDGDVTILENLVRDAVIALGKRESRKNIHRGARFARAGENYMNTLSRVPVASGINATVYRGRGTDGSEESSLVD
jgi:NADPH:quinone reductase-like Zn-dependent oxidoreductase